MNEACGAVVDACCALDSGWMRVESEIAWSTLEREDGDVNGRVADDVSAPGCEVTTGAKEALRDRFLGVPVGMDVFWGNTVVEDEGEEDVEEGWEGRWV